jgi:RNA polymerase sigma-70 factor (ECF subfamily)
MTEDIHFTEFLHRIRTRDAHAAEELVRRYEPLVRREVRLKLNDPSCHRVFDSVDICQSVLASFFVRATAGQYELEQPAHLMGLLIRMARNKVALAVRRQRAQRRDGRRIGAVGVEELDPAGATATPSHVIAARELLAQVREHLSSEERQVADLRSQGLEWTAIAATLGGTADGRRMQLTRALDRVVCELGLEEELA